MEAYKFRMAARLVAILEIIWTCFALLALSVYLLAQTGSHVRVPAIVAVALAILVLYLLAALLLSIALRSATKADKDPASANKWVVGWLLFQWISLCIMLMFGTVWIVANVLYLIPSFSKLPVLIPPYLLFGLVVLFRTLGLYFVHKYRSELGGIQHVTRQV